MQQERLPTFFHRINLCAALAAFACAIWLLIAVFLPAAPSDPAAVAAASGSTDVSRPRYYAALEGTQVAIYLPGQDAAVLVTEIDMRTLPDADQQALSEGIPLDGMDAVNQLLEDYGS